MIDLAFIVGSIIFFGLCSFYARFLKGFEP